MTDDLEPLLVEVRASTSDFRADIETMRASVDSSLVGGFEKAGSVLERGLLGAIRRGSLGFDDLKQVALRAMSEIAASAVQNGLGALFGGGPAKGASGGLGGLLGNTLGALLGLPGRATGGPVAPGTPFLVGERGPELFVPTSAGRVETLAPQGRGKDVRVSINLAAERGTDSPAMLRRSSRQVASAVARALRGA
ncbi:tail tape measure protein [Aurantiacibacter flavus]|uniref:Tail tape measure protein n=1 Tax=Aurantiacibacter flavus TaxID=3145232 RepID=A0ABV0CXD3_9SPHN